ncbi:hypothetical protein BH23ACT6_BH23ACT6_07670 [soil metagenome]
MMTQDSGATRTVLVVEDDLTINQALADRLTAEGFVVARTFDGPEALTAYTDSRLGGLRLPGVQVCHLLTSETLGICRLRDPATK